jgi:hypothetical protein
MTGLIEYMEMLRGMMLANASDWMIEEYAFTSVAELLLEHGTAFEPAPYDEERWGPRGVARECFRNATMLVLEHPDELIYVEGMAVSMIPTMHAWCVERATGEVVDPTPHWERGSEYHGIPLKRRYLTRTLGERKMWGVIENFEGGHPMLRGSEGHTPEDFTEEM